MLMDDKGKLFGKISIIDICVVLVIVALALGSAYKFGVIGQKTVDSKYDQLQYVIQVSGIRQQAIDAIIPGDEIYDVKTGSDMGSIVSKEVKPALEDIVKTDGTVVWAEKPERFDVYVTITVPGVENDSSYLANGNREINNEASIVMNTRMVLVESKVVSIKNLSK